ncbi:response regulator transcription factor [Actinomadura sp. NPDC049753]|uniref:response regulator transcription factor n=1 Tax=Actinomadura sp. NPDC049753 TaxID=3154739 RepID=UPI00343A17BA
MSARFRVVLGEDQPIVREGIIAMLSRGGIEVVASVGDATELVRAAAAERPDVVITDIRMPPRLADDGLRAALRIRQAHPRIAVMVLSQFLDPSYVLDLVGDDPSGIGYLLKEKVAGAGALADAVQRVAGGGSALDPDVISSLVGRRRRADPLSALTPRERDVLALMAEGRSNGGIAEDLVVTVAAVERHVTGIFQKLGLQQADSAQHRRVLAVLRYLRL